MANFKKKKVYFFGFIGLNVVNCHTESLNKQNAPRFIQIVPVD